MNTIFKLLNHSFLKLYPWRDYSQFWTLLIEHTTQAEMWIHTCGKRGTNILLLIFGGIFLFFTVITVLEKKTSFFFFKLAFWRQRFSGLLRFV